jgi:hypothetical protein
MSHFAVYVLILRAFAGAALAAQDEWTSVDRVVAVGDVHGDFDTFVSVLRASGLINEKNAWIGGKAHLVQTGDLVDRGADSRKVMDLLMGLEKEAAKAGGRVHSLLGNHEAMNIYGDLRYTTPGEFAAFRTNDSEEMRTRYWTHEMKSKPANQGDAARRKWDDEHPLGWVEHRIAFGPDGKYGKWLRSLHAVVKVNDVLYLHGGVSSRFVSMSVEQINKEITSELKDLTKLNDQSAVMASDGPLWYRGLSQDENAAPPAHVDNVLSAFHVKQIVVGHTPTAGAVIPRYGGKVLVIDVGLASVYGGHPVCLVSEHGTTYAVHRGTKVNLPLTDAAADLMTYLKSAVALEPMGSALAKHLAQVEAGLAAK